jgi:predicted dehydrogenase
MKMAFVGFRHGHVMGLWEYANHHAQVEVVAACEEDAATRDQLKSGGKVGITHTDYRAMLRDVPCDAVAIGDYFGKRGELVIAALEAGKHVISDKPLCTRLSELDQIETLAREKKRSVGCLLDLRDHGVYRAMRRVIRSGEIGDVQTVTFSAQHPLLYGKRAAWYFEPGKHGGTINDIAIHAVDLIPWLTGRRITEIAAARVWTARPDLFPTPFEDGGQLMLTLDNHGGVLGDVSYLSPDALAYSADQYWRITVHGTAGLVEGHYNAKTISLASKHDTTPRHLPADPERKHGIIDDFLAEVEGRASEGALTTKDVLTASRQALLMQDAANTGKAHVNL